MVDAKQTWSWVWSTHGLDSDPIQLLGLMKSVKGWTWLGCEVG